MAIRTELGDSDLSRVADEWGLGAIRGSRGLPEGSINTLYRLDTDRGSFVLRLSEGRREDEVRFETTLVAYLNAHRYPAVALVPRLDGAPYGSVRERFACVFRWGAGEHVPPRQLTREQCLESGRLLARLHVTTEDFAGSLENRYAPKYVLPWIDALVAEGRRADRPDDPELWAAMPLIEAEAAKARALPPAHEGIVHADWFHDNVRFVGDRIATVLDFEMACRAPFVFDLATAIHANCWDDDFAPARVYAFVEGYQSERRLMPGEIRAFHAWASYSALRFTITRIRDFHRAPLAGDKLVKKDWRRFRDRLARTAALGDAGWRTLCGL